MKLTHEGAARLGRHEAQGFPVCDFEFQPEDFKGAVILTAEEAKAIAYKLGYLGALTTQSKTEKETLELTDMLWWRIEQAEISIASTQCENVSKKDEKIITLTVDEAKALLRRIPEFKENGDWQLPIERLKERIEQAEGKL